MEWELEQSSRELAGCKEEVTSVLSVALSLRRSVRSRRLGMTGGTGGDLIS